MARMTKAQKDALKNRLDEIKKVVRIRARVNRDSVIDFLCGGDFNKLPEVSSEIINNPVMRILDPKVKGWTVPESDLGRDGEASLSQRNSLVLWIKQNLSNVPEFDASKVSVCYEDHDTPQVVIYRKA